MTPSSGVPYMSTSQEVKSPFLPDLKPSVSLHPSPPGECHLLLGPRVLQGTWGGSFICVSVHGPLCRCCRCGSSLEKCPCTQNQDWTHEP